MEKFKSAVLKKFTCPRCETTYRVRLNSDEAHRQGVGICFESTNKAFTRKDMMGTIWCGATIAFDITRHYTHVAVVEWTEQPNRFQNVPDEQPKI